jgi:hypothetical protein
LREVFLTALSGKNEEDLLDEFFRQWESFKIYIHWMRKAFIWVDQYALPNQKNSKEPGIPITLTNMAYDILSELTENFLNDKFFNTIYTFLDQERNKEQVPKVKVQRAVNVSY